MFKKKASPTLLIVSLSLDVRLPFGEEGVMPSKASWVEAARPKVAVKTVQAEGGLPS
jgi:hypothetical protein